MTDHADCPIKINVNLLESLVDDYIETLSIQQFQTRNTLKYNPSTIITDCTQLIKQLIKHLMVIKFSALIDLENQMQYRLQKDFKVKLLYQQSVKKGKLATQPTFQFFIIITIKILRDFFEQNFKDYQITQADSCKMYCLIIKMIIGLNVIQRGYKLLNAKYIDPQRFKAVEMMRRKTKKSSFTMKSKYTINNIERKIQNRKLKRHQNSFVNRIRSQKKMVRNEIQDFKEQIKLQLMVTKHVKSSQPQKKKKILDKQNYQISPHSMKEQYHNLIKKMSKNVMYTEQLSSSMLLLKYFNKQPIVYSKRNVGVRYTDQPGLILGRGTMEVDTSSLKKVAGKRSVHHSQQGSQGSVMSYNVKELVRKTGNYWHKLKKNMQDVNNSFQF